MSRPSSRRVTAAAVVIAVLGLVPRAAAEETEPLAVESSGRIEITDEKTLSLVGLSGEIVLSSGNRGELLFVSVKADDRKAELPIAVWLDGTVLTLRAPEGQGNVARALEVVAPPGFAITANLASATVRAAGLDGNLSVRGPRVAVDIRGVNGDVTIDADATKLRLEGVNGNATIRARQSEVGATGIRRTLSIRAVGGSLAASAIYQLDADLDALSATIDSVEGSLKIHGKSGRVVLSQAQRGGELSLSGTSLRIERCQGELTIESDAAVEFKECNAGLHLVLDGGTLKGSENKGAVDLTMHGAGAALIGLTGSTRVQGDGLQLKLERIIGELTISTSNSEISVADAQGPVTIDNDGGGISLERTSAEVKVKSRGGDLKLLEATGAVQIDADVKQVEVGWSSLSFDGKSQIKNAGGRVLVRLPAQAAARIEAESSYGQIDTSLQELVVAPDRHKAQGQLGYPNQRVVTIVAGGDVELLGGAEAASPQPADDN